jgi:micrococcal nuclease
MGVAPTTTTTSEGPRTEPVPTTLAPPTEQTATVVSVTDGDTIRVLVGGVNEPVRLIGIDAPESGQPYADESKAFLQGLVDGREVLLVRDVSDRDRFGRLLRYVYVGEVFVNLEMVRSGLAVARRYNPDTSMAEVLTRAADEASSLAMGLWEAPTTTTTGSTSTTTTRPPTTTAATESGGSSCHPSYEGACLAIGNGDYDCAGGSGNGPNYVKGPIKVVGPDEFGLDRDNDGVGCE